MKKLVILLSFFGVFNGFCAEINYNKLFTIKELEIISSAIYKSEGGNKTKYPFGIKSINTYGDYNKAKRICINTIKNNQIRWFNSGKTNDFIDFLADKYCPIQSDKRGNINWKINVKKFIKSA